MLFPLRNYIFSVYTVIVSTKLPIKIVDLCILVLVFSLTAGPAKANLHAGLLCSREGGKKGVDSGSGEREVGAEKHDDPTVPLVRQNVYAWYLAVSSYIPRKSLLLVIFSFSLHSLFLSPFPSLLHFSILTSASYISAEYRYNGDNHYIRQLCVLRIVCWPML